LAEVGGILFVSDLDVWGTAEKVVRPVEQQRRNREQIIKEIEEFGYGGKGS